MSDSDRDADARERILARRQFFIASALAGVAMTGCKPEPCLDVAPVDPPRPERQPSASTSASTTAAADPSVPPEPNVCLEMPPAPPTHPSATPSASATAGAPPPAPRVCLNKVPVPRPSPKVCLKKMPPPTGDM